MPTIDDLLGIAVREGASDLHLKAGCLPAIRVHGEIRPVRNWPRLTQENTLTISFAVMNNKQKERFKEHAEIDVAYSVPGLGRFRCNIHQQRGTVGLVFRIIATGVKSSEELKLPSVIGQIAEERRGLVLVTGATGSGKSTTAIFLGKFRWFKVYVTVVIKDHQLCWKKILLQQSPSFQQRETLHNKWQFAMPPCSPPNRFKLWDTNFL